MTGHSRARLALHLVVVVAGLVCLGWAVLAPAAAVRCHDQVMGPGDVCQYASLDGADHGKTQSYEQRLATAQSARPVVGVVGGGVAVFGAVLLLSARRRQSGPQTA